jgi:two-component system alkaline phosphatase synthesis response regulator PhoP
MAPRILVVDDDKQIVRLIRSYLEQAGMTTYVAYDGNEALRTIRTERPDLIVLDLLLPERDGWEITRTLRSDERLLGIPILMLTARVDDSDKILGFELGADDYLTKPFNPLEVVARVKAILRRATGTPALSRVLEVGKLRLDMDSRVVTANGRALDVTPTEFSILHTLMAHPNRVFTRGELIEQALGYTYEGLERTLDSHIKNLRKKIEVDPAQPRIIETVFGVGYCLREERRTTR